VGLSLILLAAASGWAANAPRPLPARRVAPPAVSLAAAPLARAVRLPLGAPAPGLIPVSGLQPAAALKQRAPLPSAARMAPVPLASGQIDATKAGLDRLFTNSRAAPAPEFVPPALPSPAPSEAFSLIVTIRVKPGSEEEFAREIAGIVDLSRSEPGNIAWQVQRSRDDSGQFVFFTRWKNEAAFKEHFALIQDYLKKTEAMLDGKPDMKFFTPADVTAGEEKRELLLGSWDLSGFVFIENGRETPFCGQGGTASGMILYQRDGGMSVAINCSSYGTGAIPAKAYGGSLFYSGRYFVRGAEVVHRIQNASVPELIGKEQTRGIARVDNHSLTLTGQLGSTTLRVDWVRK
jgi:quinol monooxygenase YgiN